MSRESGHATGTRRIYETDMCIHIIHMGIRRTRNGAGVGTRSVHEYQDQIHSMTRQALTRVRTWTLDAYHSPPIQVHRFKRAPSAVNPEQGLIATVNRHGRRYGVPWQGIKANTMAPIKASPLNLGAAKSSRRTPEHPAVRQSHTFISNTSFNTIWQVTLVGIILCGCMRKSLSLG